MDLNINLERNHYYSGKRMDKEDLILEQYYFIDKIKTSNKMLVGYGIISGLSIDQLNNNDEKIIINKGIGIDNHGNFITLLNKKEYALPRKLVSKDYVYLKYINTSSDMIPIGDENSCSETCTSNHILDNTEIFISKELLVPSTRNVCTKEDAIRNDEDIKEPLLYLGEYKTHPNHNLKRGRIDISKRKNIYTNDEIFKLLCSINQNHVRSVNGEIGDLNLVSAIGDVLPNEDGLINLVAGNNIKLESEDNEIKISTKGGFHKDYYLSLEEKNYKSETKGIVSHLPTAERGDTITSTLDDGINAQIITHNRATFPTVDVYERVISTGRRLVRKSEIEVEARDLSMDLNEYKKENEVTLFTDEFKDVIYADKKLTVSTVLKKKGIDEVSAKVLKLSDKRLSYYTDDLYILPLYSYKKIIGSTENINIEITHLDNNRVKVANLSTSKANILVILST